MIAKAEIQSIDYAGTSCVVRIPYFESAGGGDFAIATATIATIPGTTSGYNVGDIVVVAFEDGQPNQPCVIGKLYLGINNNLTSNIALNCDNLNVSKASSIPVDTKLTTGKNKTLMKAGETYDSIAEIINAVVEINAKIQNNTSLWQHQILIYSENDDSGKPKFSISLTIMNTSAERLQTIPEGVYTATGHPAVYTVPLPGIFQAYKDTQDYKIKYIFKYFNQDNTISSENLNTWRTINISDTQIKL